MTVSTVLLLGLGVAAGLITTWLSITKTHLGRIWDVAHHSRKSRSCRSRVNPQVPPSRQDSNATKNTISSRQPVVSIPKPVRGWYENANRNFRHNIETGTVAEFIENSGLKAELHLIGSDTVTLITEILSRSVIVIVASVIFAELSPRPITAATLIVIAAVLVVVTAVNSVRTVRSKAHKYHCEMQQALAAFVDFARLTSHTQSLEGSLRCAAHMGSSWPFRRIQNAISQHSRLGQPPWIALKELGHNYNIEQLCELGSALDNAGSEGTRVQAMLAAKARSLRRRITETEIEKANRSTTQLGVPLGLLAVVAVAVLLAPAIMAF